MKIAVLRLLLVRDECTKQNYRDIEICLKC